MTRYDPDLIAALAEGTLDPEDAARVEREIADNPAALAELEAQRTALTALSEATDAQLTELERTTMRAAIADALGLVEHETAASPAAPRRVPWGAVAVAGAALAGLVAVVPVVGLLNTGGDDAGSTETLAGVALSTTTIAADGAVAEAPTVGMLEDSAQSDDRAAFDAGSEAPGDDLDAFGSSTTVATIPTTTVPPDTSTTTSEGAGEGDSTTSTTAAAPDPETQAIIDGLTELREDQEAIDDFAEEPTEETQCWVEDTDYRGGEDPGGRWFFEYDDGEQIYVVYFLYDEEGAAGPFMVYDSEECEPVIEVP